ncbi:MAG: ABC transporter ATP-binding protein [Erysipelotrichaceae bacterium]|nr:ABC transporter ATP-binding protein [Erysipelotrichaceae bacterium]
MLEIEDLHVSYGMIEAVKGVDIEIEDGEIVSLIGANGAGKTTIMHAISGLIRPSSGKIILDDVEITRTSADKIVSMGLIQVPEGRHVFQKMSVEENLKLGAYLRKDNTQQDMEKVFEIFPILKERRTQMAGTLSGGEQQMLAMARALMAKPKIILLDEPSMGLAPILVQEIFRIIKEINQSGVTVFLVEQNAKMALSISDHAYVMETGSIVLSGSGKELSESEQVQKAYLGG